MAHIGKGLMAYMPLRAAHSFVSVSAGLRPAPKAIFQVEPHADRDGVMRGGPPGTTLPLLAADVHSTSHSGGGFLVVHELLDCCQDLFDRAGFGCEGG